MPKGTRINNKKNKQNTVRLLQWQIYPTTQLALQLIRY